MTERMTIQDWDAGERPREKFLEKGPESLSNAELLAILIRSGNQDENAIDLARKMLAASDNNLQRLRRFTFNDFKRFKGIGASKALSIMAAFEIARRSDLEKVPVNTRIYSSQTAADTIAPLLKDLQHEECWILYLNRANKLIAKERVSAGGLTATVVDIRMIIKNAIERLSSGIILVHNHPSGSRRPGEADKIQTQKLKKAASLCDIDLVDHLVIAGEGYFSFADEGLL